MPVRFHGAAIRCSRALCWCALGACLASAGVRAATLSEKARESGCVNKPVAVEGTTYKCYTESGAFSYFNVPTGDARPAEPVSRRVPPPPGVAPAPPPPQSGLPRVDAATQRSREDMRRKVLADELSAEERLLAEARAAYGNGAPGPLPEEKADAEQYRQRIARLRQAVELHERNIDALKRELGTAK